MGDLIPIRNCDWAYIHPRAESSFTRLKRTLEEDFVKGKCSHQFRAFEIYRSPERQAYVYRKGTSRAMPFRSPHQFGLAVDFVPFLPGIGFTWEVATKEWDWLRGRASEAGLRNEIPWDRAHIEHPIWDDVRAALLYQKA